MRDTKFRGLRTDGRGWVVGDRYRADGSIFIRPIEEPDIHESPDAYEVIADTVGQFTGLTDRNGRDIFEGDTINFTPEKDAERYILERDWNGVIEWGQSRLAIKWVPQIERKDMAVKQYCSNDGLRGLDDDFYMLITVTGNIHEQQ